jgi:hypothetical protein
MKRSNKKKRIGSLMTGLALVFGGAASAQHTDFVVARDADGKLALEAPDEGLLDGSKFIELFPVTSGPLAGYWATNLPGWESIEADEPDEGLFQLAKGHRVALRRVNWDSGLEMFDSAFGPILASNNSDYEFSQSGPGEFHEDLWFALPDSFAACTRLTGQFRLVDLSGTYDDSDPFTLRFRAQAEECPAFSFWSAAVLGMATLGAGSVVLRRRTNRVPGF